MATRKESLQAFLGEWKVHPLHTFRQGFRRTWIVRAAQQPLETVIYNDFGLAIIKEASPRRPHPNMERLQAPRPDRSIPFVREKESNYQKSWAGIVAGSPNSSVPKKPSPYGAVSASLASVTIATTALPRTPVTVSQIPTQPVSVPASISPAAAPADMSSITAAAIEAALRPIKERLEATIIPMQRTLESLQAEFAALRAEEKDDAVISKAAADAKRMRTDSDK